MDSKDYIKEITSWVLAKESRQYVSSPAEVPEGYEVHTGERGGTYFVPDPDQSGEDAESGDDDSHDPNPEEDISRFKESERADEVLQKTNAEQGEGFTLHRDLEVQELGSEDVWMVGTDGVHFEGELSKDDVIEVYEEYNEVLENSGVRLGGWHFLEEEGTFAVDISVALTDKEEAMELGQELEQEGIFNLGTEDYEPTDGSGTSPLEGPQDILEVLSNLESLSEKLLKEIAMTKEGGVTTYENEEGRQLNFFQIAMLGVKEGHDVEQTEDGMLLDGELFRPVSE